MLYGIPGTTDPATAYATAITYWVFSCRDGRRSPAKGLDTWTYLQSSIQNAAIPARTIAQYLDRLSDKLIVPALYPRRFSRMLAHPDNGQVLYMGDKSGNELRQITLDNPGGVFLGYEELLRDLEMQGISERKILSLCKPVRFGGIPHVLGMFCQAAHEVYKFKPPTEDEPETIEVESSPIIAV